LGNSPVVKILGKSIKSFKENKKKGRFDQKKTAGKVDPWGKAKDALWGTSI